MHVTYTEPGIHEPVLVLDTACQGSVAGVKWHRKHHEHLSDMSLCPLRVLDGEVFKFGDGELRNSQAKCVYPASLDYSQVFLIGLSEMQTYIPALASRPALTDLGCIPNMVTFTVSFLSLQVYNLPLVITQAGHLAVYIDRFPKRLPDMDSWIDKDMIKIDREITLEPKASRTAFQRSDICHCCLEEDQEL